MAPLTIEVKVTFKWWFRLFREPMIVVLQSLMLLGLVTERQAVGFVAKVIKWGIIVTLRGQS